MANRWGLPDLGVGVGLRMPHVSYIREHQPQVDWFEAISENFMDSEGRPRRILNEVAERYPVALHGVGMSVGSTDPICWEHIHRLRALADEVGAAWVGDHVCWTGVLGRNGHDLYPMPRTEQSLAHMVDRIRQIQDVLERPLVLENPSTYLTFAVDQIPEAVFLQRMAERADCALLLDVNNIYVSARNHGWDSQAYLDEIPWDRVVQIHLAGHTDNGTHCVDTHDGRVCDAVWELYAEAIRRGGSIATLIEWDADLPPFQTLMDEAAKARALRVEASR